MKPEDVNPKNFSVEKIIYDNTEFSIAYGKFKDGDNCIAMRWNGNINEKGYPKTFGNPMWFIIDNRLKHMILKALIGEPFSNKKELLDIIQKEF